MHKCLQSQEGTEENIIIGNEDCLYMNIYSPHGSLGQKFDVLVYIHGGGFMSGYGGQYRPENFIDNGILLVTFNYRLGPLGFLSTEDTVVPGNNGLKDQLLALQFIQDHIYAFGGNPKSVTIMGSGAGGASVNFHYFASDPYHLFSRGISQSGTMLNPWVISENPLSKASQLAVNLGCPSNTTKVMVRCLRQRSGRQIIEEVKSFQPWLNNPVSPFALVVDLWAYYPVFDKHPYQMLKEGLQVELPWIVSFSDSDGLYPGAFFYNGTYLNLIDSQWNKLLPHILDYNFTVSPENLDSVSQKIRHHYFGKTKISKKNFKQLVSLLTHRLYEEGIRRTVLMQKSQMYSPVYMYKYSHQADHSTSETWSGTKNPFGASLGDDTNMIFNPNIDDTSIWKDREMHQIMLDLVVSFVKTA